jgi:hypothetical protein
MDETDSATVERGMNPVTADGGIVGMGRVEAG